MKKLTDFACRIVSALLVGFFLIVLTAGAASAQTSAFTYQGRFTDSSVGSPTTGTYTMTFRLYDAATGGNQLPNSATAVTSMVSVVNGIFTVQLDFTAAAFNPTLTASSARYLEIQVGNSTVLTPRQEITSAPFSIRATNANSADALSSQCAACVTNAQINSIAGAKVTGTVASATNAATATTATTATTAGNVSGVVAIANGGTGSSTQNFVDLTTAQTVAGNKTLSGLTTLGGGARLQNSATDPEAAAAANTGRVYYNTATKSLRFSDGANWITIGQPVVYHVYGTAGRAAVTSAIPTVQPGMSQTITVPSGFTAAVTIAADIGGRTTVTTTGAYATIDFIIYIDGAFLPRGGFNRFTIVNPTSSNAFGTASMNTIVNVGAGTHTIELRTLRAAASTTAVDIGGNAATDVNPGEMTLTVTYGTAVTTNALSEGAVKAADSNEAENGNPTAPTTNKRIIVKENRR